MDEFDRASQIADAHNEMAEQAVRAAAQRIPKGVPGECAYCGEESLRLVGGACARCRDAMGMP